MGSFTRTIRGEAGEEDGGTGGVLFLRDRGAETGDDGVRGAG